MTKKTIIQITILHPDDYDPAGGPLDEVLSDMDDGPIIGLSTIVSTDSVPPEALRDELLALGNDGAFFEEG